MKILSHYRSEIMGICIVWIMLFHSGIRAPDYMLLRLAWYAFVSFGGGIGVDVFLICSGMGLAWSAEKKGGDFHVRQFYRRRFVRILPAYFAVAIVYYILKFETIGAFFKKLFFLNFVMDGQRDFWYIICILICYLLFPLYVKAKEKMNFRFVTVAFLLITAGTTGIVFLVSPTCYGVWEVLLWRLLAFWIGCHIGVLLCLDQQKEYYITIGILTAVSLAMMALLGLVHATNTVLRIELILISPAVMFVFAWCLERVDSVAEIRGGVFSFLGRISLELYLTHVSIGAYLASRILRLLNLAGTINSVVYLVLYFVGSILLAEFLHLLIERGRRIVSATHPV